MAKKRKAFVHVGLPGTGAVVEAATVQHRRALAELGVCVPYDTTEEAFRAALEIRRDHQDWGFRRREVEGAWARIYRRAHAGQGTVLVSQPLLGGAAAPQAELLADGLAGFQLHVVVTVAAPDPWALPGEPEADLAAVLARWAPVVRKPERLHVLVVPRDDPAATWRLLGRVVGFGTASLAVDGVPRGPQHSGPIPAERVGVLRALAAGWREQLEQSEHDVRGDLELLAPDDAVVPLEPTDRLSDVDRALREALREVERLSRRNEALEQRITEAEGRRGKRRRLTPVA